MNKLMDAKKAMKIAKALGDPYRLKMLESIGETKDWVQCSCLIDMFDLAQSTISHHLKQLIDADLVLADKDGRNAKFLINTDTLDQYMQYLNSFLKKGKK
jgi:ArsR family transcriptional regulator